MSGVETENGPICQKVNPHNNTTEIRSNPKILFVSWYEMLQEITKVVVTGDQ